MSVSTIVLAMSHGAWTLLHLPSAAAAAGKPPPCTAGSSVHPAATQRMRPAAPQPAKCEEVRQQLGFEDAGTLDPQVKHMAEWCPLTIRGLTAWLMGTSSDTSNPVKGSMTGCMPYMASTTKVTPSMCTHASPTPAAATTCPAQDPITAAMQVPKRNAKHLQGSMTLTREHVCHKKHAGPVQQTRLAVGAGCRLQRRSLAGG
jgi:hypothetical protein